MYRFEHAPGLTFEKEAPNYATLTHVSSGTMVYFVGDRSFEVPAGSSFLAPSSQPKRFSVRTGGVASGFSVHTDSVPQGMETMVVADEEGGPLTRLFAELNRAWLGDLPGRDFVARGLVLTILGSMMERASGSRSGREDLRVLVVQRAILDHPQQEVDIDALAAQVRLSATYLGVLFKRRVGVSIREYANRVRVQRARDMLASALYSPSEVADQCGFSDIFYFSRVFRRYTGKSPRQFQAGQGV